MVPMPGNNCPDTAVACSLALRPQQGGPTAQVFFSRQQCCLACRFRGIAVPRPVEHSSLPRHATGRGRKAACKAVPPPYASHSFNQQTEEPPAASSSCEIVITRTIQTLDSRK